MRVFVALLMLLLAPSAALAQALPNHADPSAREVIPDLAAVPTIRFLTTADFPPFNFRDARGELIGFNVDLAQAICDELSIACTIQAWPWDQAGDALEDNQGDALIAGLAVDAENGARFDFSAIYLMLPGRFVTQAADAARFDVAGLAGRSVAVRAGTTHEEFVRRYLPQARIMPFDTELAGLEAVAAGEADAWFGDAMRASFWLNTHAECCSFAGDPYFRRDLFGPGMAIAIAPGRDVVRLAINYALGRIKASGRFDELYLRWFPVSYY